MNEEHTVFIGRKPTMNYVLAAVTQFNGGNKVVSIKARGRSISKAVDVALILKDRFVPDSQITSIDITTEIMEEDGQSIKVSSIEISMIRPVNDLKELGQESG